MFQICNLEQCFQSDIPVPLTIFEVIDYLYRDQTNTLGP